MSIYQAYSEYKDSGVEILGALPVNWQPMQIRYLLKNGAEGIKIGPFGSALKLEDMNDIGVRVYGQENVIKKDFSIGKRKISQSKFEAMQVYKIQTNDLLITMMGTSGKCELVPESADLGIIDSHLLRLRVKEAEIFPRFFRLLIDECHEIENQIKISGKGSIMHGLNSSIVKSLVIPLPSLGEQVGILNFLDHETGKIDTLIEKQQQLIKLLKEKRQAVISHAVTKGLDPYVPMKDSGVEWLEEVPEHWKAVRLKQVAGFITSGPRGWSDFISDSGKDTFLQSGDLNHELEILPHLAKKVTAPAGAEGTRTKLQEGDVVICITGANTGRVAVVNSLLTTIYINQHLSLIRLITEKANPMYIGYALSSQGGSAFFNITQYGLKEGLSLSNISEAPVALPPIDEQNLIVKLLKKKQATFNKLIDRAETQIDLLQERRTALISAAVTGKIDVRNWKSEQSQPCKEATA
jgi:type I restriction enzyme S subunit